MLLRHQQGNILCNMRSAQHCANDQRSAICGKVTKRVGLLFPKQCLHYGALNCLLGSWLVV